MYTSLLRARAADGENIIYKQTRAAQKRYKCCIVVSPLRPCKPFHQKEKRKKKTSENMPRWESLVERSERAEKKAKWFKKGEQSRDMLEGKHMDAL
jgi:hypothetical protein